MINQNTQSSVTRDMAMGDTIDRQAWSRLTIFEQMGSIHPEEEASLERYFLWFARGPRLNP